MTDTQRPPRHLRAQHPRFGIKGIYGTQLSGGNITGKENNPQLTGLNWVSEAEEMMRTDPIVRRSWHMLRQTLLSASWRFVPGVEGDRVAEEDSPMNVGGSMATLAKCLSAGKSN